MLRKTIRKISYLTLWVFYPVTFIINRDKNLWLFGTNFNIYSDNPKYLFEYTNRNLPQIRAIWISSNNKTIREIKNLGFEAYNRYSIKGFYLAAKAGVYIYSHEVVNINLWLCRNAFRFNTWHGIGLKKVASAQEKGKASRVYNLDSLKDRIYTALHSPQVFDKNFYMLASSKRTREVYSESFRISKDQFLIAGYPRHEPFFSSSEPPETWKKFNSVVIYTPTFRDVNPEFLSEAIPDPKKMNQVCKQLNMLFVFKLHPFTKSSETKRFEGYSNFEILDSSVDIYPLLKHTKALITDYSSVLTDYIVLEKPILLYAYDLDHYLENNRDFYYNYSELSSNKQIDSFENLLGGLKDLSNSSIDVLKLKDKFWEKEAETASQDITKWLISKQN